MDAVNLSEKYIFLDLRSWEINIARTARRLGVSRNTVRHLQSLSSEEVLQQKERHYKLLYTITIKYIHGYTTR